MTTQINPLVTEKEIVDVIYEAGQMPIKTLSCHFWARIGSSKEAQREFVAKLRAVAERKQYEEDGKTVTYIMLKAATIEKYGLATETCGLQIADAREEREADAIRGARGAARRHVGRGGH